jgi:hypothetical protein
MERCYDSLFQDTVRYLSLHGDRDELQVEETETSRYSSQVAPEYRRNTFQELPLEPSEAKNGNRIEMGCDLASIRNVC